MQKQVAVYQEKTPGYGGPDVYWAKLVADNILLDGIESGNRDDIVIWVHDNKPKWQKDFRQDEWDGLVSGKLPASELCSVCGANTLDGTSYCVEMIFCKRCTPRIDEFREKYQEKEAIKEQDRLARHQASIAQQTRETRDAISGAFHCRDGWFFGRTKDGGVRVMRTDKFPDGTEYLGIDISITPELWASVICSVSARGETLDRWQTALKFHGKA